MAGSGVLVLLFGLVGCDSARRPAPTKKPPQAPASDKQQLTPEQVATRVAALREQLKSGDVTTAVKAADGLTALGRQAAAAVPDLLGLIDAEEGDEGEDEGEDEGNT
jgi:hypothetical protein